MNGVFQTIFQRGISAGLYFPLEEIFTLYLKEIFQTESKVTVNSSSSKSSSYKNSMVNHTNETWILLSAGLMAGAGNGFLMNPISSIKYHYWGLSGGGLGFKEGEMSGLQVNGKKNTFYTVASDMFLRGGLRPFFVGVNATIGRDVIFGGAFSYLRHELPKLDFFNKDLYSDAKSILSIDDILNLFLSSSILPTTLASGSTVLNDSISSPSSSSSSSSSFSSTVKLQESNHNSKNQNKIIKSSLSESKNTFLTDLLSGLIATTLSSPLNYVRNIHYSLPPDVKPNSTYQVLTELWKKSLEEKTTFFQLKHLQSRLRLGWGTARVGCGMALASQFYSYIKSQL